MRTLDEIGRWLHTIPDKARAVVAISPDARASHGRVIQVVDLVRQAGIFRLDIETFSADGRSDSH